MLLMTDDEILKVEELIGRVEYLERVVKELQDYVEKMSYAPVVDNPKKDLVKILKRGGKE